MSPGNSYFKDEEVSYLLKSVVGRYGKTAILIADIPAISTYIALGYPENRARRDKALPQGNNLKNRTKKVMTDLGFTDAEVKIIDWETEIELNADYKKIYEKVQSLYKTNTQFKKSVDETTKGVLIGSGKDIADMNNAVKIAVHYLLSEIAFLEYAPEFLKNQKIGYVYHKNWPIYEDYIAGKFDGSPKSHMDFILLENPYETYNPMWSLEEEEREGFKDVLDRIEKTKTLRVGFIQSVPTFMYDKDHNFSGIFYEIIVAIAKKHAWEIRYTEETGYGVIAEGLNNDRFDIFGPTVWPTPERLQIATFSRSLFKSPVFTYVRADDPKSEEELKNDKNMRVVIVENDIMDSIAQVDFPDNRQVRVPQLSSNVLCAQFVADGRGDFTFREKYLAEYFNKSSNIKLVAASETPIRFYENTFMLKKGENRLKEFLDKELDILEREGIIRDLIKKYTGNNNTFEN